MSRSRVLLFGTSSDNLLHTCRRIKQNEEAGKGYVAMLQSLQTESVDRDVSEVEEDEEEEKEQHEAQHPPAEYPGVSTDRLWKLSRYGRNPNLEEEDIEAHAVAKPVASDLPMIFIFIYMFTIVLKNIAAGDRSFKLLQFFQSFNCTGLVSCVRTWRALPIQQILNSFDSTHNTIIASKIQNIIIKSSMK